MHGHNLETVGADDPSELNQLESALLADVSNELEKNNVDKVARDIFSFYVCVRWVPDPVFWAMARQELAEDLSKWGVNAGGGLDHAIAELYQNYKFIWDTVSTYGIIVNPNNNFQRNRRRIDLTEEGELKPPQELQWGSGGFHTKPITIFNFTHWV